MTNMDEVLEKLESAVVTESKEDGKSMFEDLYKNWGRFSNQEERRKEILEKQKCNRKNNLDNIRGILELVNTVEETDIFHSKKVFYRPNIYVAGFHRAPLSYKNVLMLSEWMVEKPEDFKDNWYVVPCPKGVRMLVVAARGITNCYTKYGHFRFEQRTALPGGNPCDPRNKSRCCVLDCFYHEKSNTMFVLDILAWNTQPMTDGETDFRYFWLQSQLEEINDLKKISKTNKLIFSLLPKIPCTSESLNEFLMKYPAFPDDNPKLDGLLFYHKRAHYVSGETPLVGWLFPFMVPEIIGQDATVCEVYLKDKPSDYTNQAEFIQKFEQKYATRQRKRSEAMDTSDIDKNENGNNSSQTKSNKKSAKSEESAEMEAEVIEAEKHQIIHSLMSHT